MNHDKIETGMMTLLDPHDGSERTAPYQRYAGEFLEIRMVTEGRDCPCGTCRPDRPCRGFTVSGRPLGWIKLEADEWLTDDEARRAFERLAEISDDHHRAADFALWPMARSQYGGPDPDDLDGILNFPWKRVADYTLVTAGR